MGLQTIPGHTRPYQTIRKSVGYLIQLVVADITSHTYSNIIQMLNSDHAPYPVSVQVPVLVSVKVLFQAISKH